MRERVTLYGGTLETGPGAEGRGFRVRAVLPVQGSELP
jgi:signal transduction histidine kinase